MAASTLISNSIWHLPVTRKALVEIGSDGHLLRAEVLQSSDKPELDRLSLESVHDAAPYPAFDQSKPDMSSYTIQRIFDFGKTRIGKK